ncbi:MAG: D-alanyl-D-alanine carboxypeptidase family protein [Eubacteriales bacterium]|nr:D-alanyl-D-alanine carboxypeptidase [Lachnospiraceae bacterium]MDO5127978.1 D-alanyl-D-alanine carboxypeptidase family protein [Eubacteriales bacterium]
MKRVIVCLCVLCMLMQMKPTEIQVHKKQYYSTLWDEIQAEVITLQSKSACVMEVSTGEILFEKNADMKLRPASVTKVMTLLLIFDGIKEGTISYDDIVTVTEHAASMGGSQCFFETGEQQTVRDMIKCIEIASGNDAAVAMAEHIAGSETAFVQMMNERALELGMNNTHFENACGLEAEGHLTSARDIAIMSRELLYNYPEIKEFSTIWMDSITHKTKRGESRFDLANTNKFLNQYTGATGLKTGYTSQAKYCMSASAERKGIELIAVVMGAETKDIRNSEAGKLLDYGFARCEIYVDDLLLPDDLCFPVSRGRKESVSCVVYDSESFVLVDKNKSDIKKNIIPYDNITAPVKKGDIIGTIQYCLDETVIHEISIYAGEDVDAVSYAGCLSTIFQKLFMMTTTFD